MMRLIGVHRFHCAFGSHQRSARAAKLVGGRYVSSCRHCGTRMLRLKEKTWIVHPGEQQGPVARSPSRPRGTPSLTQKILVSSLALGGAALLGGAVFGVQATADIRGIAAAGQAGRSPPPARSWEAADTPSDLAIVAGASLAKTRRMTKERECASLRPDHQRGCLRYVANLQETQPGKAPRL